MWKEQIKTSAKSAAWFALIVFAVRLVMAVVVALVNLLFEGKWYVDWELGLITGVIFGGGLGFAVFVASLYQQRRVSRFVEAVSPAESESLPVQSALSPEITGFAAMEYYSLMMNRSFLVYVAPEGLYGWLFEGMVDASDPAYFEPYANMLKEPSLLPATQEARQKIAKGSGNFYIRQQDIVSVEYDPTPKWGMSRIPHSGKLQVRLIKKKSREFILLGSVYGEGIRQSILKHGVSAPI